MSQTKSKRASSARYALNSRNEINLKLYNSQQSSKKQDTTSSSGYITQTAKSNGSCKISSSTSFVYVCSGCSKPIKRDKFLLKACDKYWHENCLKCDRCHSRLGELGSTLYCKSNMNLCRQDYLEMFGKTGVCSVCEKLICASEMVMRAKQNVYHLECFACQLCNQRFCVGDRFYLCENKVVCQYDYEEHILPIQQCMIGQTTAIDAIYPIVSAHHHQQEPSDSTIQMETIKFNLTSNEDAMSQPQGGSPKEQRAGCEPEESPSKLETERKSGDTGDNSKAEEEKVQIAERVASKMDDATRDEGAKNEMREFEVAISAADKEQVEA